MLLYSKQLALFGSIKTGIKIYAAIHMQTVVIASSCSFSIIK